MTRGKKTSPLEDCIDLVAMLPCWACVTLALVSYVVLSSVATPAVVVAVQPSDIAHTAAQALWKSFAYAGQFIAPFVCLIAGAVSAYRRHERKQLVSNVVGASSVDALGDITWREFEMLVGESFRLKGYQVSETGGGGPDGGVDLVLSKDGEKFLVQCKQWKAFKVGVSVVRELYGVMAASRAAGGFVITSGRFTDEARAFADGRNVRLVDGPKLFQMIKQAKAAPGPFRGTHTAGQALAKPPALTSSDLGQMCPLCASAMAIRVAKRGANAGASFWGCTRYPACKGTRSAVSS
jgi:restriction system protein